MAASTLRPTVVSCPLSHLAWGHINLWSFDQIHAGHNVLDCWCRHEFSSSWREFCCLFRTHNTSLCHSSMDYMVASLAIFQLSQILLCFMMTWQIISTMDNCPLPSWSCWRLLFIDSLKTLCIATVAPIWHIWQQIYTSDFVVLSLSLSQPNCRNRQAPPIVVPEDMGLFGTQYSLCGAVQMGQAGDHFVAIVRRDNCFCCSRWSGRQSSKLCYFCCCCVSQWWPQ